MCEYPVANSRRELITRPSNAARDVSEWAVRSVLMVNPNKTHLFFRETHCKQTWQNGALWRLAGIGRHYTIFRNCRKSRDRAQSCCTFSWKPYIDLVTKQVNRFMYPLRSMRSCTTQKLRQRLVEALVLPDVYKASFSACFFIRACAKWTLTLQVYFFIKLLTSALRFIDWCYRLLIHCAFYLTEVSLVSRLHRVISHFNVIFNFWF